MKTQFETALEALIDKLEGWFTGLVTNLPNIILAVIVLLSAYFLAKYTNRYIYRLVSKRVEQESINNIISKVASVAIVVIALFLSLGILNLDQALTSILTGAGITGLVVGLALQGTLSNTIAGIILSFRKKIQIGNWVETSGFAGEVMDINLKGFILKEADNNLVIIPNKTIIDNPIKNYSLTTRMRVTIECGVGYESDLEAVETLTKSTVSKTFKQIDGPEEVEFFFTEYGGSSINFICRFWIDAENSKELLVAKSKAIIEIKKAFDAHNINIP
ncbi:MAG: mechanosensitive ion channel family protein, partial [Bacteroidia bacterium]|nr:mechanosensitive ion channel family protein [Bacteroidia bacterium]